MENQPIGSDDVRNKMKEHSNRMHHKIDAESLRQMLREVKDAGFLLSIQLFFSKKKNKLFFFSVLFDNNRNVEFV